MLTESKDRIVRSLQIVEPVFDDNQTRAYALGLQIGLEGADVLVIDPILARVLAVERFTFQSVHSFSVLMRLFGSVLKDSSLLTLPYKNASIFIVNKRSTLIPEALYTPDKHDTYFSFNHKAEEEEVLMVDDMANTEAKNIFALPAVVRATFRDLYANCRFHHYTSALAESILALNKNAADPKMILNVRSRSFDVIVVKNGELLFMNSFDYSSPEDFIYYTLFVMEQLRLNPETLVVEAVGDIEKEDLIFKTLYKYIRNVRTGSRPDNFTYGTSISALPAHRLFSSFAQFVYASTL